LGGRPPGCGSKLSTNTLKNAIQRAKQLKPFVAYLGERHFCVASAHGPQTYQVRFFVNPVTKEKFGTCDCKAGENAMACYHLAAAAAVNIGVMSMRQKALAA